LTFRKYLPNVTKPYPQPLSDGEGRKNRRMLPSPSERGWG
jgi:hypothetical protein